MVKIFMCRNVISCDFQSFEWVIVAHHHHLTVYFLCVIVKPALFQGSLIFRPSFLVLEFFIRNVRNILDPL